MEMPSAHVIGAVWLVTATGFGLSPAPTPSLLRNRTLDVALFVRVQRGILRIFWK